jgi:hypothetical protein
MSNIILSNVILDEAQLHPEGRTHLREHEEQSEVNCRVFKPCEGWEITLDARIYHRFYGHFYREAPQNLRKAIPDKMRI